MPCDYRILQSLIKGQALLVLLETVGRSLNVQEGYICRIRQPAFLPSG